MPTLFFWKGYRFFFFSDEGSPLEPCHIHVSKGDEYAKIWLGPYIRLEKAYGMDPASINSILKIVDDKKDIIKEKWDEYFIN